MRGLETVFRDPETRTKAQDADAAVKLHAEGIIDDEYAQELERTQPFPAVARPTLGIWSSGDNLLLEEGMLGSGEHVNGPWRYERIEGAGHWLQLDAPTQVNTLLLEFLV